MTRPGGVALACVRCENGYWVLTLSHPTAEPMSKEQLDAVKEQLLSEENSDLRQSIFKASLEDPKSAANIIITFAAEKGLQLEATADDVIDYMNSSENDDVDVELTPEMMSSVSGGWAFAKESGDKIVWGFRAIGKGFEHVGNTIGGWFG